MLCEAHFLSSDIQKKKNGQKGLKADSVPVQFMSSENQHIPESPTDNGQSVSAHCGKCNILEMEIGELKRSTFKTQVDSNLELRKKNDQIEKLMCKCDDQSIVIKGLKSKIVYLEKLMKRNTSEIKSLQEKINRLPETNVNSKFYLMFIMSNN